MKHTRSSAEWEIRDALVSWLRAELPRARIIHELVVGGNRADVAAVTRDKVFLFEIKSEKDTLDRLDAQMRSFSAMSHHAVLVAHQRWFDTKPYDNGAPRLAWPEGHYGADRYDVWAYPQPDRHLVTASMYSWRVTRDMLASMTQPAAYLFLHLMWKPEALDLGRRHGVAVHDRLNQHAVNDLLAWSLTGKQITEGVCAALRARPFAEADAPILPETAQ